MKGKALPFVRHEQFSVSYSCIAYIEQSDSLTLKVLRITEEFELQGFWKAMAVLKIEYVKLLFYSIIHYFCSQTQKCAYGNIRTNPQLSPPYALIFFWYCWVLIFNQFWQYLLLQVVGDFLLHFLTLSIYT